MKHIFSCILILLSGLQATICAQLTLSEYEAKYDSLYKIRDYEASLSVVTDWENTAIQLHGAESIERVRALAKKARYVMEVEGSFPKSETLFLQCIEITEKLGAVKTNEFAFILLIAASVKQEQAKLTEAISLFQKSLAIRTELFGPESISALFSKSRLAGAYLDLEKYEMAEPLFLSAISALEQQKLERHTLYLYNLRKFGDLLTKQSRFEQAIELQRKCVGYAQNNSGVGANDYFNALFGLGRTLLKAGRVDEAEPIFRKVMTCPDPIVSNNSLQALAATQLRIGLYDDAFQNLIAVQKYLDTAPQTTALDYAQFYGNLSGTYYSMKQFEQADSTRLLALEGFKAHFGDTNSIYLNLLLEHATSLVEHRALSESESFLQKNTQLYARQLNNDPFFRERVLALQGEIAFRKHDYQLAHRLYSDAIEINHEISYSYIDNLLAIAKTLVKLKRSRDLESTLSTIVAFEQRKLEKNFAILSDQERQEAFLNAMGISEMLAYSKLAMPELEVNKTIFNLQIFAKSILENTARKSREYIKSTSDSLASATYAKWIDAYEQLNYAYTLSTEKVKENGLNIHDLENKSEVLQKELTQIGVPIIPKEELPNWQQIRDALNDGEAALDIARLRAFDGQVYQDTAVYQISILKPGINEPIVLFLENGNELESFVLAKYLNEISQKKDLSPALSEKLWAVIGDQLAGVQTLYFSPDGIFHKINLNTLQSADGAYLLDRLTIKQVTNLRNIIQKHKTQPSGQTESAVLFGNPSFQLGNERFASLNTTDTNPLYRDIMEEADGNLHLDPLPGSQKEVEQIAQKLSTKKWKCELFTDINATEDAVKQVKSPKVLHIATHGYFLSTDNKKNKLNLKVEYAQKNPALRSMIFFAGAGNTISGERAGKNDGILTAFEAAVLNLDQTELVVLSACNTGLGKIQNGEGVYGLQRAFRIAGAKSIIMSLWEVEDAATELLMNQFYDHWLSGMSKTESFRKAQLALKAKYPAPFYWGSFILVNG